MKAEIQNKPAGKDPVDLKEEGGTGLDTDKESQKPCGYGLCYLW